MAAYAESKARIFANQRSDDVAVLNGADPRVRAIGFRPEKQATVFRLPRPRRGGPDRRPIGYRSAGPKFALQADVAPVEHRVRPGTLPPAGTPQPRECAPRPAWPPWRPAQRPEGIQTALDTFVGLAHRLSHVASIDGVDYYDDSKATNVDATARAVETFHRPVVLILGGRDKGSDWDNLRRRLGGRVKKVIVMGEAAGRIRALPRTRIPGGGRLRYGAGGAPRGTGGRSPATWCCWPRGAPASTATPVMPNAETISSTRSAEWKHVMTDNKRQLQRALMAAMTYDFKLLFPVLLLVGIGIVMVYSSSSALALKKFGSDYYFLKKQAIYALAGVLALVACRHFPYRYLRALAYPLMGVSLALLVATLFSGFGFKAGGATRWLHVAGFTFQPSELARFALVIYLAYSMNRKADKLSDFFVGFLPHVLVLGVFTALIFPSAGLRLRGDHVRRHLDHAVCRRGALYPPVLGLSPDSAGGLLRPDDRRIPHQTIDELCQPLGLSQCGGLPDHPLPDGLRNRRAVGHRHRQGLPETVLPARAPHRFRFFSHRRGTRAPRRPCDPVSLRHDPLARPSHRRPIAGTPLRPTLPWG